MAGIGCSGALSRRERRGKLGRKRIGDVTAKVVIYEVFVEGKFEARSKLPAPCDLPFEPKYEEKSPLLSC